MSAIRFTLPDSSGESHDYTMTLHLGGEGSILAMQIMGFIAEPALNAVMGLLEHSGGTGAQLLDLQTSALFDGLDQSTIGPALGRILTNPDAHKIVRRDLVKYVHRDGKPLAQDTNFDQAFQGNYGELFKVVWEVAKRNRFLPLGSTS